MEDKLNNEQPRQKEQQSGSHLCVCVFACFLFLCLISIINEKKREFVFKKRKKKTDKLLSHRLSKLSMAYLDYVAN